MRDDEGRSSGRIVTNEPGELGLSIRIDASCRFVQDKQIRVDDEDRGQGQALALAAREITRVPIL